MNLTDACLALGVSRSGYHDHRLKHQRPRRTEDAQLARALRAAFDSSRQTYGAPRLMHTLRAKGLRHGKNRLVRLMRRASLRSRGWITPPAPAHAHAQAHAAGLGNARGQDVARL